MYAVIHSGSSTGGDQIQSSTDAVTWTAYSTDVDNNGGFCIAYGNGIFVAVGLAADDSTSIAVESADGVSWSTVSIPQPEVRYVSAVYGGGQFVILDAATETGTVITSTDGVTWTQNSIPGSQFVSWTDITYGAGLYVAVGAGEPLFGETLQHITTSPDGITWTTPDTIAESLFGVCYGDGQFVAVGLGEGAGTPCAANSPDGFSWTEQGTFGDRNWVGVAYGAGIFVAVAHDSVGSIMTSTDGATWTLVTVPDAVNCNRVRFIGSLFIATCDDYPTSDNKCVLTSPDGLTWTTQTTAIADFAYDVAGFVGGITFGNVFGPPNVLVSDAANVFL